MHCPKIASGQRSIGPAKQLAKFQVDDQELALGPEWDKGEEPELGDNQMGPGGAEEEVGDLKQELLSEEDSKILREVVSSAR